jgi:hypothetical protein
VSIFELFVSSFVKVWSILVSFFVSFASLVSANKWGRCMAFKVEWSESSYGDKRVDFGERRSHPLQNQKPL